jgi:hypothetical protein
MKKLIAAVISMVALSSCIFAPFSKSCKCPPPELPNHLMDVATEEEAK